jgi:ATP-dependent Zn protease
MTIVPNPPRGAGPGPAVRIFLFWLMVAWAVLLWKMASPSGPLPAARAMSYGEFLSQLDQGNIASAKLAEGPSTTQIQGQLRRPAEKFAATIPNDMIFDVTQHLQKQGATIDAREAAGANSASATSLLIKLTPLLLLLGALALLSFRGRLHQRLPAQQGTPSNRPLG